MKIIKPSFEILTSIDGDKICKLIEIAGRTCYKSEDKITDDSARRFVAFIVKRGHLSVIEHVSITVKFICDRGVTHELVRHRLASYSQESTRYCNYSDGVTFIKPCWIVEPIKGEITSHLMYDHCLDDTKIWLDAMMKAEYIYKLLLDKGWKPQQARSVLPNSLKTEIVATANLREWHHIFKLRTSNAAHPQIREIMQPLLNIFKKELPEIYGDVGDIK